MSETVVVETSTGYEDNTERAPATLDVRRLVTEFHTEHGRLRAVPSLSGPPRR
jgi:hypothetical protein